MTNLLLIKKGRKKQGGNFTIELAIIGIFFSLLIAFSGDVIIKLSIKGKLDRMAFSAASIMKERTQLFSGGTQPSNSDSSKVVTVVSNSLNRTISDFDSSKFGMRIEVFGVDNSGDVVTNYTYEKVGKSCSTVKPDESLFVTTAWGNSITLYQTTVCYETNNWYGSLVNKTFNYVQSYAAVMGR